MLAADPVFAPVGALRRADRRRAACSPRWEWARLNELGGRAAASASRCSPRWRWSRCALLARRWRRGGCVRSAPRCSGCWPAFVLAAQAAFAAAPASATRRSCCSRGSRWSCCRPGSRCAHARPRIAPPLPAIAVAVVWVADIGAYFAGRASASASSRPRSAPARAGKACGAAGRGASVVAAIGGCAASAFAPSLFTAASTHRAGSALVALLAGRDERRRRPVRVACQARRRRQGSSSSCCPATAACSIASTRCCRVAGLRAVLALLGCERAA